MKSFSFTFYHQPLKHGGVDQSYVKINKSLFGVYPIHILGYEADISGFKGLHIDTWLSLENTAKRDGYRFGSVKTGGVAGHGQGRLMGLDLTVNDLYLAFWCHNMTWTPKDWHVTYVVYIE